MQTCTCEAGGAAGTRRGRRGAGRRRTERPDAGRRAAAIGLSVRDLDRDARAAPRTCRAALHGVWCLQVEPLSPAYEAGIERGDVILEINRQQVASAADYARLTAAARPGDGAGVLRLRARPGSARLRTVRVELRVRGRELTSAAAAAMPPRFAAQR